MKLTLGLLLTAFVAQSSFAGEEVQGHLRPPEKVTDRVYVMRQPDRIWSAVVGNVTIIEQSDGVVLIDTGGTLADGRNVAAQVHAMTNKPVKAIIITHWHNDHPLGLGSIVREWPKAKVISTRQTRELMQSIMGRNVGLGHNDPVKDTARLNQTTDRIRIYEANARDPKLSDEERREYAIDARYIRARLADQMGGYIVLPTQVFTDRYVIDDPQAPVELHFLGRANTAGDAIAWLPKQGVLVTGDMVVAPVPYGFNSPPSEWIDTLGKLKSFNFTHLIPGHGVPQTDTTYIDRLILALREIKNIVAPLAVKGLSLEEVQAQTDFSDQTRVFAGESPWARLWFKNYWLDPAIASAYREAKGEPVREGG